MKRIKKRKPLSRKKRRSASSIPTVAGSRGVTAGFPEFWPQVHDKYPLFFAAASDLQLLVDTFINKPVKGSLNKVLHFLAVITSNSFGSLIVLTLNGYGHDSMRVARGMYEAAVNAAYLKLHPTEVNDYLDYYWIRAKKLYDYFQQNSPSYLASLKKKNIEEIKNEFAKVKLKFQDRRGHLRSSWCKKNLRARAQEVGLDAFYPTFYSSASGIHHGDVSGLVAQGVRDAFAAEIAPSFAKIKDALMMGHYSVLVVLLSYNETASLGMEKELEAARDAFKKAWKKTEK